MSANVFMLRPSGLKNAFSSVPKKKRVVTGIQERSEAEAMIQRYLELAANLLREEETPQNADEICA